MTIQKNTNLKGFTIIEVVLVLAIAGLIFLMVFIALPNMQRSQRDTARRNDYAALSSNITNYLTNNNGRLPSDGKTLAANTYINTDGKDSQGNAYDLKVVELKASDTTYTAVSGAHSALDIGVYGGSSSGNVKVFVVTHANCGGETTKTGVDGSAFPVYDKSARAFAIFGQLETGLYCQQNT